MDEAGVQTCYLLLGVRCALLHKKIKIEVGWGWIQGAARTFLTGGNEMNGALPKQGF